MLATILPAVPANADMVDMVSGSLWAEACAKAGVREADRWVALSRKEWCEEFVGDFGRVHSWCRQVVWKDVGANRLRVVFTKDETTWNVELVTPNRLSVFSESDGELKQEARLGRARINPYVETIGVECR